MRAISHHPDMHAPLETRYWRSVSPPNSQGCQLWSGDISYGGWGLIGNATADGEGRFAVCVAWEYAYGPIPDDLWVLHKCGVRACVNPEHLFLGTDADAALAANGTEVVIALTCN